MYDGRYDDAFSVDDSTDCSSVGSSSCSSSVSCFEIPSEQYRYKVVYPGGTYVRVSPNIDAEKTGEILECGAVVESSKSIVLDGVTYVRLTSTEGWVFESKKGVKVLELIECVRDTSMKGSESTFAQEILTLTNARRRKSKLSHVLREEIRYWKSVRNSAAAVLTFEGFVELSSRLEIKSSKFGDVGPCRGAWITQSIQEQDQQIRQCLSRIVSVVHLCAAAVSVEGLDSALWVLCHLGNRVNHIIEIAVEEASVRFENTPVEARHPLLLTVLEVAARTRDLSVELALMRGVDLMPDDLRHYLQRWIIIRVRTHESLILYLHILLYHSYEYSHPSLLISSYAIGSKYI